MFPNSVIDTAQMQDAGLMTAILALSSQQLSLDAETGSGERDRDRRIGLQYYYETLHYLQKAMSSQAYTVSLELLATALIVSMSSLRLPRVQSLELFGDLNGSLGSLLFYNPGSMVSL